MKRKRKQLLSKCDFPRLKSLDLSLTYTTRPLLASKTFSPLTLLLSFATKTYHGAVKFRGLND